MLQWLSRCTPGITVIFLIVLIIATIIDSKTYGISPVERFIMIYTTLVHINAAVFSCRLIWALICVEKGTRELLRRRDQPKSKDNYTGLDNSFTDAPTDAQNGDVYTNGYTNGDIHKAPLPEEEPEVLHVMILPNYMEDLETLRRTLSVLASHPRAKKQYEVVLAMEQKEAEAGSKAAVLTSEFENKFVAVRQSFHPHSLPGEIAGKSSNVAFAARSAINWHRSSGKIDDIILTVMDADTHLWMDYFTEIRRMHHEFPLENARAFYMSPIIFDRNAHDVPLFVRCADLLWGFAGLAGMYPGAPIAIPTSVYSIPMVLADNVGGWDSDATAIGEDMHMLLKSYFGMNGDIVTRPIYAPASQCNISASGDGYHRYLRTLLARYRQALRHMWGALDSGYALRSTAQKGMKMKPRHVILMHLMWEAHFLPTHLTMLLIFSALYPAFVPAHMIHPDFAWTLNFTGWLRTACFIGFNISLAFYDRWHAFCVNARARDMARAGISDGFSYRTWRWYFVLDRLLFPVAGTIYGAVAAIHAEFAHFFTDRLVYTVSFKPSFAVSV